MDAGEGTWAPRVGVRVRVRIRVGASSRKGILGHGPSAGGPPSFAHRWPSGRSQASMQMDLYSMSASDVMLTCQ